MFSRKIASTKGDQDSGRKENTVPHPPPSRLVGPWEHHEITELCLCRLCPQDRGMSVLDSDPRRFPTIPRPLQSVYDWWGSILPGLSSKTASPFVRTAEISGEAMVGYGSGSCRVKSPLTGLRDLRAAGEGFMTLAMAKFVDR
jgi:hypothetical protein